MSDAPRYALYYAPRPEEGLAVAASQWLGWNPEPGRARTVPLSSGIDSERLGELTAEPRRYGFHGTLKPPIALADEVSESDFLAAVGRFAAGQRPFTVPSIKFAELSDFLALVPTARSTELQDLADRCVVEFDEFRRPAGEEEVARRRQNGLAAPEELWALGLSYVLEEWRST